MAECSPTATPSGSTQPRVSRRVIAGMAVWMALGLVTALALPWAGARWWDVGLKYRGSYPDQGSFAGLFMEWNRSWLVDSRSVLAHWDAHDEFARDAEAICASLQTEEFVNGVRWSGWISITWASPPDVTTRLSEIRSGWPLRSASGWRLSTRSYVGTSRPRSVTHGLTETAIGRSGDTVWIPLYPHWPGLLSNTAFFAALSAAVFHAVVWFQRTLRARRGGCRYCGYSVTGLPAGESGARVCPECGRAERVETMSRGNHAASPLRPVTPTTSEPTSRC